MTKKEWRLRRHSFVLHYFNLNSRVSRRFIQRVHEHRGERNLCTSMADTSGLIESLSPRQEKFIHGGLVSFAKKSFDWNSTQTKWEPRIQYAQHVLEIYWLTALSWVCHHQGVDCRGGRGRSASGKRAFVLPIIFV